jgi:hypothetical protein
VQTVDYAPGRRVDVFGDPHQRSVLMWHGRQTDARTAVRPLAEAVADHKLGVLVPDWDSHAADGGGDDQRAPLRRPVRAHGVPCRRVHDPRPDLCGSERGADGLCVTHDPPTLATATDVAARIAGVVRRGR